MEEDRSWRLQVVPGAETVAPGDLWAQAERTATLRSEAVSHGVKRENTAINELFL